MAVETVTGATPAWFCEFDTAPSKVLAHHWPGVPNHRDVTTINWEEIEPVDILTGGSPCQDLSAAGKRAGMTEGTRSNLWVNMREAINHLRPKLVVWENVLGALSAPAESESDAITSNMEQGGDYWETPEVDIFGHSVAYSETLPKSGTTRNGQLYEHRTSAHPTTAPASSSSPGPASMLPTPMMNDGVKERNNPSQARRKSPPLSAVGHLLPTPNATMGDRGHSSTVGGHRPSGQPRQVDLNTVVVHLPTPNASDASGGGQHPSRRVGHSRQLIDYVLEIEAWNGANMPPLFDAGNEP